MDKNYLIKVANDTQDILKNESYNNVNISKDLNYSIENSILYKPGEKIVFRGKDYKTIFDVKNISTLAAGKSLVDEGYKNVMCLNFASAKYPGGGWLKGSKAQEESLVRSSGLFATINQKKMREMYDYNISLKDSRYSDYMIYSPNVPVFRDDDYNLLDNYYRLSFITSPAVNCHRELDMKEVKNIMQRRINKILAVAAINECDTLVLGAFGCGVFHNNPKDIADIFYDYLNSEYYNTQFKKVIFAVKTNDYKLFNIFERKFKQWK